MTLNVNEIFYSIQGESLDAGRPCVFVRLTGCNLRCAWCDTRYAYDEGRDMPLAGVMDQVAAYGCPLVEITGGEPLLQDRTPELARELIRAGHQVLVETNGTRDLRDLPAECVKIVDIKCPASGESGRHRPDILEQLTARDQVKFVIADRTDYLFASAFSRDIRDMPPGNILFSPVGDVLSAATLADWILTDHLEVRLQVQLHRIIWKGERGK
ncbi:MAG: radical SAM protein [Thermodesulfobacteriota bacterium]